MYRVQEVLRCCAGQLVTKLVLPFSVYAMLALLIAVCCCLVAQMLHSLDAKVDGVINAASGLYSGAGGGRGAVADGGAPARRGGTLKQHLDSVTTAKDAYLRRVEEALQLLRVRFAACISSCAKYGSAE